MILLAWFEKKVTKAISEWQPVIHFDEQEICIIHRGSATTLSQQTDVLKQFFNSDIHVSKVAREVGSLHSTWARWVGDTSGLEVTRQEAAVAVSYIVGLLSQYSVKLALFHTASPHHFDTSILYAACQVSGIPSVFFRTSVFDRTFIMALYRSGRRQKPVSIGGHIDNQKATNLIGSFEKQLKQGANVQTNTKFKTKEKSLVYFYYKILLLYLKKFFLKRVEFCGASPSDWYLLDDLYSAGRQKKYITLYKERAKKGLAAFCGSRDVKLIIAAHYQPEASTVPDGGMFADHISLALQVKTKGFDGSIFYKEHPATAVFWHPIVGPTRCGLYKNPRFLYLLERLNINCLPSESNFNGTNTLHSSNIVVTITGNIAIERSLLGLKTIVAGHPWYEGLPGVVMLEDLNGFEFVDEAWLRVDKDLASEARQFLIEKIIDYSAPNSILLGMTNEDLNCDLALETIKKIVNRLPFV